jgi:pyrroline-5-carboxylate reductase
MPNVAAMVGESFTAYRMGSNTTPQDKEAVEYLLGTMGSCIEVEEKYMDPVTGLGGSGPAYIAIVIDALTYTGLRVDLHRELSKVAAAQSVLSTAKLIMKGASAPSEIEEMVTTPGGTPPISALTYATSGRITRGLTPFQLWKKIYRVGTSTPCV